MPVKKREKERERERERAGGWTKAGQRDGEEGTTRWHTVEGFAVAHPGITYLGRRPYSRRARAGLHNGHGGRSLPRRFTIMRREGSHSWASHLSATKGYRGSRWITILSSLWPPRRMVLLRCCVDGTLYSGIRDLVRSNRFYNLKSYWTRLFL